MPLKALLDRFGLSVEVVTPRDIDARVEVVRQRDEFERDPVSFAARFKRKEAGLRKKIAAAREVLESVEVDDAARRWVAGLCVRLGTDGLRGEIVMIRAARALAALERAPKVRELDLRRVASISLRHRLRRDPLDDTGSSTRVERALDEMHAG